MLREPRRTEAVKQPQKTAQKGRFRLVKLEERIAPKAHTNHGHHHRKGGSL